MEAIKSKKIILNKYLLIIVFESLLFLPYLFKGPVGSDSSDDLAMNLIASGAFGTNSQYLVYSSIIYGWFLKFLYMVLPGINWYLTIQFFLNYIAVTSILLCLATFLSEKRALCASMILHFYFALEFYEKQQFSQNASLYALAGFILFFTALYHQRYAKKCSITGAVMLFLSGLVRFECFLFMLPFGILILFAAVQRAPEIAEAVSLKEKIKTSFKKWCISFSFLFGTVLLCLSVYTLDQMVFWQKAEWKSYKEYHWEGVIPLLDVDGTPEFDAEALSRSELTAEDIYLFYLYQYADMDYYSIDRLKQLASCRTATGALPFGECLFQRLKELYAFPVHYNDEVTAPSGAAEIFSFAESLAGWNLLLLLLLLVPLAHCKGKRRFLLIFFTLFAMLFLSETVFLILRGHAPRRVLLGSRCAVELFTAFLIVSFSGRQKYEEAKAESTKDHGLLFPACMLLIFAEVFFLRLCWHAMLPEVTETKQLLDSLRSVPEEHYLLDANFLWAERLGISDPREISMADYKDYFRPFMLSGGWIAECDHALHYRSEEGIDDPVMALPGNIHMAYVVRGYTADICEAWMRAHLSLRCGCEIRTDTVYSSDTVSIFRFSAF